jgi:hypothetical protein
MTVPVFLSIGVDVETDADFTGDLKDASNCTAFSLVEKVFTRPRSMRIANTIYDNKKTIILLYQCGWSEGINQKVGV